MSGNARLHTQSASNRANWAGARLADVPVTSARRRTRRYINNRSGAQTCVGSNAVSHSAPERRHTNRESPCDVIAIHASDVSTYLARCYLTQHVQPRCGITKTITRHEAAHFSQLQQSGRVVLTFVGAAEVAPLFSETPHQQTPRFSQGTGGRTPRCLCRHPLR